MNTKVDSPLPTGPSTSLYSGQIQAVPSTSYSGAITSSRSPVQNDTPIGLKNMTFPGVYPSPPKIGSLDAQGWVQTFPARDTWTQILPNPVYKEVNYPPNEIPKDRAWVEENEGYPDNNPKTAFGAKKIPLELVPPSAVAALAEAFADGAKKYGPYNWRTKTVSSSIYYAALLRHVQAWWDGEDLAEDTGISHLYHALACLAIIVDASSIEKLNDNRPPKGAASKLQKGWVDKHG